MNFILIKILKIQKQRIFYPIGRLEFRSKIHNFDQNYGFLIGNMEFRSEFQPPDRIKSTMFLIFSVLIKIKFIYLISDWSRDEIMTCFSFNFENYTGLILLAAEIEFRLKGALSLITYRDSI